MFAIDLFFDGRRDVDGVKENRKLQREVKVIEKNYRRSIDDRFEHLFLCNFR
jgi:hypothetical protein